MDITFEAVSQEMKRLLEENSPVRVPPPYGAVGKKGTNMRSLYPGYLRTNAFDFTPTGVRINYNKVGYVGYANARSKRPQFIEKSVEMLISELISAGGRRL